MKIRVAYVDEPPFYYTTEDKSVRGADIELAEVILGAIGVTEIEYVLTEFDQLLVGVDQGRWDMNVPIFVTPERSKLVTFSKPVWAIGDGFVIQNGNPKALSSYEAVAARKDARLGIIPGQVQHAAAQKAGVSEEQIVLFKDQSEAVSALMFGKIDAFAGTSIGSRAIAAADKRLDVVSVAIQGSSSAPVGAYSFAKSNTSLIQAFNAQLQKYVGSDDHVQRMTKHGITKAEIDGALQAEATKP